MQLAETEGLESHCTGDQLESLSPHRMPPTAVVKVPGWTQMPPLPSVHKSP